MPIINRIAEFHREMTEWRQDLHAHPELALQETRTSGVVQAKLKEFGVDEIITGMARTGVVGVIRGQGASDRAIGLRADMDALPILEETGAPYASQNHGVMHACGHDGHTTMLLGAAKYLAETRNFDGTVYVIFQPAEENLAGGEIMVKEGLFERCKMEMVFGMHNWPQMPAGTFAWRNGPIMAAVANIEITITGKGTHGAQPHFGIDPIVIASHIVTALQTIVARTIEPVEGGVVTIGHINGGHTYNVIPETVRMLGTARWFDAACRRSAGGRRAAARHRHRRELRRQGRRGVQPRLSRDGERSRRHHARPPRRRDGRRRGARDAHAEADDGRRGFLVHAERQAGQLHHAGRRPRQGRRDGPSPALRLQRRDPAGRRVVLGDAGRAVAAAGRNRVRAWDHSQLFKLYANIGWFRSPLLFELVLKGVTTGIAVR